MKQLIILSLNLVAVFLLNTAQAVITEEQLMTTENSSQLIKAFHTVEANNALRADLVSMLKSSKLAVRCRSLDLLEEMAGDDFGFDPWMDPDKADPAPLLSWEKWLDQPTGVQEGDKDDTRLHAMILTGTEKARESACRALLSRKTETLAFLTAYLEEHPELDEDTQQAIRQARFRIQLDSLVPNPSVLARKLIGNHKNDILDALEALRKKSNESLPVIHEFLEHRDPLVREAAVDLFLQTGKETAAEYIVPLLEKEKDENVLQIAFRRAGETETNLPGMAGLLTKYACSESEDLSMAALKTLSEMNRIQAAIPEDQLLKLFNHKEWRIRSQALLYAMKHKAVKAPALGSLNAVQEASIKSGKLQPVPGESLYPRVLEMLRDEDESVRIAAFRVVAVLKNKDMAPTLEQLAFEMPEMVPVVLYALMANDSSLSPAMQALIKRLPSEKVTVLLKQESSSSWTRVLTKSQPNDTAKLVLQCLMDHQDPEVKNILAVAMAGPLNLDSPQANWELVLNTLENPAVPLKTKATMIDAMSLRYGDIPQLLEQVGLDATKQGKAPLPEVSEVDEDEKIKIEKLKPFGLRLFRILKQCSVWADKEDAELQQLCSTMLLMYGDEEVFQKLLKEYSSLSKEYRKAIVFALTRREKRNLKHLPLVKLIALDEDQNVRKGLGDYFEQMFSHMYRSMTESQLRNWDSEWSMRNDPEENKILKDVLDEIFTHEKYGNEHWNRFIAGFLNEYYVSEIFERLAPEKYSTFFLREYIRNVVENPQRPQWHRDSGAFALFVYEYPHHRPFSNEPGCHEVLQSLRNFPPSSEGLAQWMEQWSHSRNAEVRRNVASMLISPSRLKLCIRAEDGTLLISFFRGLKQQQSQLSRQRKPPKPARCPQQVIEIISGLTKDEDIGVRTCAYLSLLTATRKCDVEAFCVDLTEVIHRGQIMDEQGNYSNEWNALKDAVQDGVDDLLESYGNVYNMPVLLFSYVPPKPRPRKGELTEDEKQLFIRLSTEVMKDRFWSASRTVKYGSVPRNNMSFSSIRPEKMESTPEEPSASAVPEPASVPLQESVNAMTPFLIIFFEKSGCQECARVREYLERCKGEFPGMQLETYSIMDQQGTEFNSLLAATFKIASKDRLVAPAVFGAGGGLMRDQLTESNLRSLLQVSRKLPDNRVQEDGRRPSWAVMEESAMQQAAVEIRDTYERLSIGVILLGGLIDGINPCAFATLIFFLSYLQIARKSPRQLLLTGGSFVLSVYVTYFAIGLGFHELIGQLQSWAFLKTGMDVTFSLLALLAAFLSFRDAWLARRGRLSDMSLALPEFLKKRIRQTTRVQSKSTRFILAAFVAGIIISLLELACTGQVYAPIIYQISRGSSSAVAMLALYNLAFILPLLLIFFLAYRGMKAEALIRYQQKHAVLVKLLLGVLFLGLAAIIIWSAAN